MTMPSSPRLYLHAWLATGDPEYRRVTEETLDYLLARDDDIPSGGFFSAQDADSEGVEGKFFVWTPEEIRALVPGTGDGGGGARLLGRGRRAELRGPQHPARAARARRGGGSGSASSRNASPSTSPAPARIAPTRLASGRVHPGLDDKVLAAWNGLALAAFAEAGRALGRPDYLGAAVRSAEFLTTSMMVANGRLHRSWKDGRRRSSAISRTTPWSARGLARRLRGHLRPALAGPLARARRGGAAAVLGRGARGLLRHRLRPGGPGRPAAKPLRQCACRAAPR